jgi:hypothetical protein
LPAENSARPFSGVSPLPALIGAVLCVVFLRIGILKFFFLTPLGFAAAGYGAMTGWVALLFAAAGNSLLSVGFAAAGFLPWGEIAWDFLYFTVMPAAFLWILIPPRGKGWFFRLPGVARFAAGSAVSALLALGVLFHLLENEDFLVYVNNQIELVKSLYRVSGADVTQNALLESLTADFILRAVKMVLERGGALASCVFIFFVNRQISFALARLFRRREKAAGLGEFHVPAFLIWVLSFSLLLVLVCRAGALEYGEILGWNILTLCCILYLAQGLGIIRYFLTGTAVPPSRRILISIVLIILLFSFGINAIILGLIILLGIAEHWAPLRRPKPSEPPSTPGA